MVVVRKVTSIFFLCLFLLYQVGYLGYYWYSHQKINDKWNDYVTVTPDMKHVTIPVSLPYWNSQSEYQATHGKIIINGDPYRKVMQKYDHDAIHLIVAKDQETTRLNQNISDWIQAMSDGENSNQHGESSLLKSAVKDYTNKQVMPVTFNQDLLAIKTAWSFSFDEATPAQRFATVNTPPPQA